MVIHGRPQRMRWYHLVCLRYICSPPLGTGSPGCVMQRVSRIPSVLSSFLTGCQIIPTPAWPSRGPCYLRRKGETVMCTDVWMYAIKVSCRRHLLTLAQREAHTLTPVQRHVIPLPFVSEIRIGARHMCDGVGVFVVNANTCSGGKCLLRSAHIVTICWVRECDRVASISNTRIEILWLNSVWDMNEYA